LESSDGSDALETEADLTGGGGFYTARHLEKQRCHTRLKRADAIEQLASELVIHPAIIAGRIRRETGNYRILKELVGQGGIRRLFTDVHVAKGDSMSSAVYSPFVKNKRGEARALKELDSTTKRAIVLFSIFLS